MCSVPLGVTFFGAQTEFVFASSWDEDVSAAVYNFLNILRFSVWYLDDPVLLSLLIQIFNSHQFLQRPLVLVVSLQNERFIDKLHSHLTAKDASRPN